MDVDNLAGKTDMILGVMNSVSELHVTKHIMDPNIKIDLSDYMDKVFNEVVSYPKGIAYKASQCEFVLHTHEFRC